MDFSRFFPFEECQPRARRIRIFGISIPTGSNNPCRLPLASREKGRFGPPYFIFAARNGNSRQIVAGSRAELAS